MKEYIAETGGRYTYSDDLLNLQELALSMTSVFEECSAFIISGCLVEGEALTSGYVWLGNKVRYFEGCLKPAFPFYIYERNGNEPVVYANEVNKRGRCCYQCAGGNSVPSVADPVTGFPPAFLEITKEYAPRLIDKFFGRYALLLDAPSPKQKVKRDVTFAGEITVEKALKSAKEVTVQATDGRRLCSKVKENGGASLGAYLNELLTAEVVINTDGSFSFLRGTTELAKIGEEGFACDAISLKRAFAGDACIFGNHIINIRDQTDEGSINVNHCGLDLGVSRFRSFNVYDGKRCSVPLFRVDGKEKTTSVSGVFRVSGDGACCVLRSSSFTKGDMGLTSIFEWQDRTGTTMAFVGYGSGATNDFAIKNLCGNLVFTPKGYIDLSGEVRLKGADIYSIFTTQKSFNEELAKKVSAVSGKQLSTEDFTAAHKMKLDAISTGAIGSGGGGYVTADDVTEVLKQKMAVNNNLRDLSDKGVARSNLSVYSVMEIDKLLENKLGTDGAYSGVVFTEAMRTKLEGVKTGHFAYIDNDGVSQAQVQGYALISQITVELAKKADRLMTGYTYEEMDTIASNLNFYTQGAADRRFAKISSVFKDYIDYLIRTGVSIGRAHEIIREELEVYSEKEIDDNYLRKDGRMLDLQLPNAAAKRSVCRNLGAAYADDYQTKLTDTGWLQMGNAGAGTDTRQLFIRQIGNIVSIQGIVNTAKREGSNMGGIVAFLPNQIQPPKYDLRTTLCDWDDDAKYNRGASFVIRGGYRSIQIYESGWYNVSTGINFTYFV